MVSIDRFAVLITCEHATCFVPKPFRHLFSGHDDVVHSHLGWDPGTLDLGELLSKQLDCPLFKTKVSRLLVEVNRSTWHKRLFSDFSCNLDHKTKQAILDKYYFPYRNSVEDWIRRQTESAFNVVHLSLHSFTPCLHGVERTADIGLLYDPRRQSERTLCCRWRDVFRDAAPHWRVRRNYPYLGRSDGLTSFLRKRFADELYCGIELEINQRLVSDTTQWHRTFKHTIAETIQSVFGLKYV